MSRSCPEEPLPWLVDSLDPVHSGDPKTRTERWTQQQDADQGSRPRLPLRRGDGREHTWLELGPGQSDSRTTAGSLSGGPAKRAAQPGDAQQSDPEEEPRRGFRDRAGAERQRGAGLDGHVRSSPAAALTKSRETCPEPVPWMVASKE